MVGFKKLTSAFEQNEKKKKNPKDKYSPAQEKGLEAVKQSLSIVNTIDKLKAQGIAITKKAELDYLLAMRVLERADIDPELLYQYRVDNNKAKESDLTIGLQKLKPGEAPPPILKKKTTIDPNSETGNEPLDTGTMDEAPQTESQIKRTPEKNPDEFKKAMEFSKKCVAEVDEMLKQGTSVPIEKFEEYNLCKKFLAKYQ